MTEEQLVKSDLWRHMIKHHEEDDLSLMELVMYAGADHPTRTNEWLLELVHNRQHTSLDWDAGHDEDDY
jgi:hypothetical protein